MDIQSTIRKQIDAVNRHDPQAIAAHYAKDATVQDPQYEQPLRGRDAIKKDYEEFLHAFPDLSLNLERTIVEGDTCAVEVTFEGTHKGKLQAPDGSVEATNKRVQVPMSFHARVGSDGCVTEEKRYYDYATIFSQLGVSP